MPRGLQRGYGAHRPSTIYIEEWKGGMMINDLVYFRKSFYPNIDLQNTHAMHWWSTVPNYNDLLE